tara:strand:+ start:1792 stop:2583 length:792 start_codon:yes stop_codon:yes gene_type:complete
MNKHTLTPLLKFIQKILTKLINYYKYIKVNILPEKSIHSHGFSTKISNLPNCYQRFKEEEMDKCYNTFKKHFYNAVFLETKQLQKYSINEALKNDNESSELYYLEFGVGAGSSINYFSDLLKKKNKSIFGFDSFVGLKEDWKGHVFYPKGSLSQNNIQPKTNKNVSLIAGWIQDTLPLFLKEKNPKINFLHIDVDTYESTKFILKETKQYLSKNCIIVFDDFYNFSGWSVGEYKALIEEFKESEYNYIAFSLNKGNVAIQLNL